MVLFDFLFFSKDRPSLVSNEKLVGLSLKYEVPIYLVQNLANPKEEDINLNYVDYSKIRNDLAEFILGVEDDKGNFKTLFFFLKYENLKTF